MFSKTQATALDALFMRQKVASRHFAVTPMAAITCVVAEIYKFV
jgi:ApbE superfamily uncharacterized protein (UPF0280 family)